MQFPRVGVDCGCSFIPVPEQLTDFGQRRAPAQKVTGHRMAQLVCPEHWYAGPLAGAVHHGQDVARGRPVSGARKMTSSGRPAQRGLPYCTYPARASPTSTVISSFQDRHVVDLGGHVEDGVVDVTAVAA